MLTACLSALLALASAGCRSSADNAREKPGLDRVYFDINNDGVDEFVEIARGVDGGPDIVSAVATADHKLPPGLTTVVAIPFRVTTLATLSKVVEGGKAREYLKVDSEKNSFVVYSSAGGLTTEEHPAAPAPVEPSPSPSASEPAAETPAASPTP